MTHIICNAKTEDILGLHCTGIWPESASFRDDGIGQIPRRWKGQCVAGDRFSASNCNRFAFTRFSDTPFSRIGKLCIGYPGGDIVFMIG
jgi:hypothetical protein